MGLLPRASAVGTVARACRGPMSSPPLRSSASPASARHAPSSRYIGLVSRAHGTVAERAAARSYIPPLRSSASPASARHTPSSRYIGLLPSASHLAPLPARAAAGCRIAPRLLPASPANSGHAQSSRYMGLVPESSQLAPSPERAAARFYIPPLRSSAGPASARHTPSSRYIGLLPSASRGTYQARAAAGCQIAPRLMPASPANSGHAPSSRIGVGASCASAPGTGADRRRSSDRASRTRPPVPPARGMHGVHGCQISVCRRRQGKPPPVVRSCHGTCPDPSAPSGLCRDFANPHPTRCRRAVRPAAPRRLPACHGAGPPTLPPAPVAPARCSPRTGLARPFQRSIRSLSRFPLSGSATGAGAPASPPAPGASRAAAAAAAGKSACSCREAINNRARIPSARRYRCLARSVAEPVPQVVREAAGVRPPPCAPPSAPAGTRCSASLAPRPAGADCRRVAFAYPKTAPEDGESTSCRGRRPDRQAGGPPLPDGSSNFGFGWRNACWQQALAGAGLRRRVCHRPRYRVVRSSWWPCHKFRCARRRCVPGARRAGRQRGGTAARRAQHHIAAVAPRSEWGIVRHHCKLTSVWVVASRRKLTHARSGDWRCHAPRPVHLDSRSTRATCSGRFIETFAAPSRCYLRRLSRPGRHPGEILARERHHLSEFASSPRS